MRRLQFAMAALLLVMIAPRASADSIVTFNITHVSIFVFPNDGSGDNVGFALTGPGTSLLGGGGFGCFDWCSILNGFAPGSEVSPDLGQLFLGLFTTVKLGGKSYDPDSLDFTSTFLSVTALGGFTLPANPNVSTFTACVPAGMTGATSGFVGSGDDFIQFNLKMPTKGNFCTTWNFNAAAGQYFFSSGKFEASTVPEPQTITMIVSGLVSIAAALKRSGSKHRES